MGLLGALGMLGGGGGSVDRGALDDWFKQFQPHPDQASFNTGIAGTGDVPATRQMPDPVSTGGYQPPTGGVSGQPTVDPGQLQMQPPGLSPVDGTPSGGPYGNGTFHPSGPSGGMLGALGPQGSWQQAMARMRTPTGRVLNVPLQHIQEALARGAQHV
jgi:hypothetical protein